MEKQFRIDHTLYESDRNPIDVMTFETYELENQDIVTYIADNYLTNNSFLKEKAAWLITNITNGCVEREDVVLFFTEALLELERNKRKINYVVWLASEDAVREQYSAWFGGNIMDVYDVSNAIILSDLGYDGRLYGFSTNPIPLCSINL